LEYLVHQIDNARDLDIIDGLKLVVFLLEHKNDTVQCNAAHVIGATAQRYNIITELLIIINELLGINVTPCDYFTLFFSLPTFTEHISTILKEYSMIV